MQTGAHGRIDMVNALAGELVAYWAVIAVFIYYYEVIARYVFNSPTNWVHESMFLMFGMQYMLAGAYAYRDETSTSASTSSTAKFSPRGTAICRHHHLGVLLPLHRHDAGDRLALRQRRHAASARRSFTEWGIQYWPVKLTIPIGAALLLLQGISRLVQGHRHRHAQGRPEPWASKFRSNG